MCCYQLMHKINKKITFSLPFFVGCCFAQTITTPPKDKTVKVGDLVQLDCAVTGLTANNQFQWLARTVRDISEVSGVSLFQVPARATGEPTFPTRHSIAGTYNLQIKSAVLDDGGWYACQLGLTTSLPANLVVISK